MISSTDIAGYRIELTPLESFCFGLKHLWQPDEDHKPRFRILDTLVFLDGLPNMWLFSSLKTGEIMRKKAVRLQSHNDILSSFRNKSHSFRAFKPSDLKSKIALVWFVRNDREIASYLVDEHELIRILNSSLLEIIAVQVYLGGHRANGNGVFSHKLWRLRNGSLKHQSYESVDADYHTNLSQYSVIAKQLVVQEHQNEILKSFSLSVARFLENHATSNLEFLSIQVSFDGSWSPFLVAVRDVVFMDVPRDFIKDIDNYVFIQGKRPIVSPFNENTLLLPNPVDNYSLDRNIDKNTSAAVHESKPVSHESSLAVHADSHSATTHGWRALRNSLTALSITQHWNTNGIDKSILGTKLNGQHNEIERVHSMQYHSAATGLLSVPPPDSQGHPTYHERTQSSASIVNYAFESRSRSRNGDIEKEHNCQQQSERETLAFDGNMEFIEPHNAELHIDSQQKIQKQIKPHSRKERDRETESVHLRACRTADRNATDSLIRDYNERNSDQCRIPIIGDVALTMTNQTIDTSDSNKLATNKKTYLVRETNTLQLPTDSTKSRDMYDDESHSLIGGTKELKNYLEVRRPISAPHRRYLSCYFILTYVISTNCFRSAQ
jgi:hypothetical protein